MKRPSTEADLQPLGLFLPSYLVALCCVECKQQNKNEMRIPWVREHLASDVNMR